MGDYRLVLTLKVAMQTEYRARKKKKSVWKWHLKHNSCGGFVFHYCKESLATMPFEVKCMSHIQ